MLSTPASYAPPIFSTQRREPDPWAGFSRGEHVRVWRGLYWHHAIYIGNGWLIEFGGGIFGGDVHHVHWGMFARGEAVQRVPHAATFAAEEVAQRAESQLGLGGFDLVLRNCEHFAHWCATDRWESSQVKTVAVVAATAVGCFLLAGDSRVARLA
ncbi:MAG: lecithin retinol acyltransferase family protein [Phycisphaerales bacterium]